MKRRRDAGCVMSYTGRFGGAARMATKTSAKGLFQALCGKLRPRAFVAPGQLLCLGRGGWRFTGGDDRMVAIQ